MLSARLLKTADIMYLYSDGHAVVVHRKQDKEAGRVEWVTLHESIGVRPIFKGRLIIKDVGAIALLLAADSVNAMEASVSRGSDNTKERGIAVGYIAFNFGRGWTYFNQFDALISSDFTYQPDHEEKWSDVTESYRWADYRVSERFSIKQAA